MLAMTPFCYKLSACTHNAADDIILVLELCTHVLAIFLCILSWDKNNSYILCHLNRLLSDLTKTILFSSLLEACQISKFLNIVLNLFDKSLYKMTTKCKTVCMCTECKMCVSETVQLMAL